MESRQNSLQDPTLTHRLFQLIARMTEDERRTLLNLLEDGLLKGKCRRKHFRIERRLPVIYANERHAYRNFIRDISLGGVFMLTSIPFKVGDEIRIVFNWDNQGNPLRLLGKVARVTPEGVGVRFISLNQDRRAAILSLASEAREARRGG